MSEHAEPVAWTQPGCPGEYVSMHEDKYHTVPLYTAPLNLNDPAVQKRLAAQWGYVKAEPGQEPVAWIHTDADKPRVKFLEWRENEPGYRGRWIKTPLYTAPPQRPAEPVQEINPSSQDRNP